MPLPAPSAPPPSLAKVAALFEDNFRQRGEVGAALSIWHRGAEILHLCGGSLAKDRPAPWTPDSLVPVWSATKGPAALTLLLLLHQAGLSPDTPLRSLWPRLALPLTFAQLLSHQAGLPALDHPPSLFDHAAVVAALEAQTPAWAPGTAHGYHPRTFGPLLDECARRLTGGTPLGAAWHTLIAKPFGIDFFIGGLPADRFPQVARLYPGPLKPPHPDEAAFFAAIADPTSLTRRAFRSPAGLHAVSDLNQPAAWQAALPAFGGLGSARGLAKFYALLAQDGSLGSPSPLPPDVLAWARTPLVQGPDLVLRLPTAFSAGFMMDPLNPDGTKRRQHFGPSPQAFGHPGAGGSLAFADPSRDLAFAYTMNQMEPGVLPNPKSLLLVEALFQALD